MATDNTFKNSTLVARFAIKALLNYLKFADKVDRQFDEKRIFAKKVGNIAFVRRPVYFVSSSGAIILAGQTTDIEEATVPVALDNWRKVVFNISSEDSTLRVEDEYERLLMPAMYELAQDVESAIAAKYTDIFNFTGTPGTSPSKFLDVASAGAKLDLLGVPDDGRRCAFFGPLESVTLADGLKGVFPQGIATKAIERAQIGNGEYGGFMCYKNQSLKMHTVGVNTGTPLVNLAAQNTTYALAKDTWSQTLNIDGWTNDTTAILKAGDIFTLAGVYAVNRRTRESTGELAQFTNLVDVDSGASTGPAAHTISPPIIIDGPYQTVTAAPANNAAVTVLTGTGGSIHRQNIAFHKNAITLATARLDLPQDGATASRVNHMGVSVRVIRQYDSTPDETRIRMDILFGVKVQNPEFAVRITS